MITIITTILNIVYFGDEFYNRLIVLLKLKSISWMLSNLLTTILGNYLTPQMKNKVNSIQKRFSRSI